MSVAEHFDEWRAKVIVMAYKNGWYDPKDLADETLLRCWVYEQAHPEQTLEISYAFRTAYHLHVDRLRRAHGMPLMALELGRQSHPVVTPNLGLGVEVEEVLATLLPRQQRIVRLATDGYSYAEIAAQLGVTVDTIKKQAHYAHLRARRIA